MQNGRRRPHGFDPPARSFEDHPRIKSLLEGLFLEKMDDKEEQEGKEPSPERCLVLCKKNIGLQR